MLSQIGQQLRFEPGVPFHPQAASPAGMRQRYVGGKVLAEGADRLGQGGLAPDAGRITKAGGRDKAPALQEPEQLFPPLSQPLSLHAPVGVIQGLGSHKKIKNEFSMPLHRLKTRRLLQGEVV